MLRYTIIFVFIFALFSDAVAQDRDQLPVREYTNPDEVVTFDRTTPFARALDVINEFAQERRGKVIIDRSGIDGDIGISVPPMHWMDALRLILNVKQRQLIEQPDFYEIVNYRRQPGDTGQSIDESGQVQAAAGDEGPPAYIGTREVRINAIFFEGNRRALREIGVDWSTLSNNVPENVSDFTGGQQQGGGGQQEPLPSADFQGPFVQVNSRGAQSVSQNVFNALLNLGEIGNTGVAVQALFSAFEADNLGEILASPTVKVMDGEEGMIQVGQDFSIKQRDFAGNVTDNFVSVGTILEVTPQVLVHNDTTFIHLTLRAERSSAQPDPVSTIINKQEAETQSLLLDGEATVIAGLYRTEKSEVRRGIPILKDLPPWFFGLRYLFGFNSEDYQMSELVVLLQASLEPSIADRYGKEMANKFELLRDERVNSRREIQQREQAFDETDAIDDDDTNFDELGYEDEDEREAIPPSEEETVSADTDTLETEDENLEQDDEEEPVITDPEVQIQEIPLNFTPEAEKDTVAAREDTAKADEAEMAGETAEEEAEAAGVESDDTTINYFIIGGSFGVEKNAVSYRRQLAGEGFDAIILEANDMYMVAYRGYNDLQRAKTALSDIKEYYNSEAWLFRNQ